MGAWARALPCLAVQFHAVLYRPSFVTYLTLPASRLDTNGARVFCSKTKRSMAACVRTLTAIAAAQCR